MATQHPSTPDDAVEVLDLRQLVTPTQPIMTSAGRLELRRMATLSPLERAELMVLQQRMRTTGLALDEASEEDAERLRELALAHRDAEDALLAAMLPGVSAQQLEELPVPERVGIITAFSGATPLEARRAVEVAERALEGRRPRGARSSRASNASTAATRKAG